MQLGKIVSFILIARLFTSKYFNLLEVIFKLIYISYSRRRLLKFTTMCYLSSRLRTSSKLIVP